MQTLTKKVVLITGCSKGGIGHSLALEFASHGCTVYASVRNPTKAPSEFSERGVHTLQLDVVSDDSVSAAVEAVIRAESRIDVLVNNAGHTCISPVIDADIGFVQSAFDTNVIGVARVTKAVVPHMVSQRSGTIVNVGSVVAYTAIPWGGFYSATKAAIHNMSDVLRVELSPFGIDVVVVAPGSIQSNLADHYEVDLPSNSVYTHAIDSIRERARISQAPDNTKCDEFARMVVPKVLGSSPSAYITCGKNWIWCWALYYFPVAIRDAFIGRLFKVSGLRDVTGIQRRSELGSIMSLGFIASIFVVLAMAYRLY